jgi:redox-sensitive bicupin YhaK (pirin superfamily)
VALRVVRARERYHHQTSWLSTYWHFSFDHYHDPANVAFGPLRVFNDDTVAPGTGFPPHSHADMEIVSYVLSGTLEHRDSAGHRGRIGPGELQLMSAGTGITHAESNPSATEPVHFLQVWILRPTVALGAAGPRARRSRRPPAPGGGRGRRGDARDRPGRDLVPGRSRSG